MLLTNGCSYVWGDELEGFDQSPPNHHNLTFSYRLANLLGMKYTNLATCGASNYKIYRDTLDHLMKAHKEGIDYTHMVIIWSHIGRIEIADNINHADEERVKIQRFQCLTQIASGRAHNVRQSDRDFVVPFLEKSKRQKHIIDLLTYMRHIQFLCDLLDIRLIQGSVHKHNYELILKTIHPDNRKVHWGPYMDYVVDNLQDLREECRVGLGHWTDMYSLGIENDDILKFGHPGKITHRKYGSLLYHIFKKIEEK